MTDPHPPTGQAELLPPVAIDLDQFKHRYLDHWVYGPPTSEWPGGARYKAHAFPSLAEVGEPTVEIDLCLQRDDIPKFVAWLTAVYHASTGDVPPLPVDRTDAAHPPLRDTYGQRWTWQQIGDRLGYIADTDEYGDSPAPTAADVADAWGPVTVLPVPEAVAPGDSR